MKQYRCSNCDTPLELYEENGVRKGRCPACLSVFFLVDLETAPIKERLYDIVSVRGGIDVNRSVNIKAVAGEILNKSPDDDFGKFYFALGDKMLGNNVHYRNYLASNTDYDPFIDKYNKILFEDLIEYCDGEDYDLAAAHLRKVLTGDNLSYYLQKLKTAVEKNAENLKNYLYIPRDVFICHSRKNAGLADAIAKILIQNGISVWVSTRNIRPGSPNMMQDIYQGILNCRLCLAISDRYAMTSAECLEQLTLAKNLKKERREFRIDNSERTETFENFFDDDSFIDARPDPLEKIYSAIGQIRSIVELEKLNESRAERESVEMAEEARQLELKQASLEQFMSFAMTGGKGIETESDVMRAALMFVVKQNFDMANNYGFQLKRMDPDSPLVPITDICISVKKMFHRETSQYERARLETVVRQNAALLKSRYPVPGPSEKDAVAKIESSEAYALLANTFSMLGEKNRREFVMGLIKPGEIFDPQTSASYLGMLYKLKNYAEIRRFIMNAPLADPGSGLVGLLFHYEDQSTKKELIEAFGRRNKLNDYCCEKINEYLITTRDDIKTMLQALKLLTNRKVGISGAALAQSRIGDIQSYEQLMEVLNNLTYRSLTSRDVDVLLSGVGKYQPETVIAIFDFLQHVKGIHDVGQTNIKNIAEAIVGFDPSSRLILTQRLFEFEIDRATKDRIIRTFLSAEYDRFENLEAIINIFASHESLIMPASYEAFLMKKFTLNGDKALIVRRLVEITAPFGDVSALLKRYIKEGEDDAKVKKAVAAEFDAAGFAYAG